MFRRAQQELKRLHERIEAAEKKLAEKEFGKRDLYLLQWYREYAAEIIDASGVDDFISREATGQEAGLVKV